MFISYYEIASFSLYHEQTPLLIVNPLMICPRLLYVILECLPTTYILSIFASIEIIRIN